MTFKKLIQICIPYSQKLLMLTMPLIFFFLDSLVVALEALELTV